VGDRGFCHLWLGQPSHQHFDVTIEQSLCTIMAESVPPSTPPVNAQAVGAEQIAAREGEKRGSATAGMFSDLTVDV